MLAQLDRLLAVESLSTVGLGVIPWRRAVPVIPMHGFSLCDREAVVVETIRGEHVLDDSADVASYEGTFSSFEEAATFGAGARELLLQVMNDFRALGDDTATR